ncbi:unnamed protein product [Lactuca virosa]|uniref:Toprim domain-containing protein n=1 Tax=Lactuca virosa TaxID=75947 RepID=A0AAU9NCU3_9ASTR|nr:unnamed protein product [Lactuca virosa]
MTWNFIKHFSNSAVLTCFRAKCGWKGSTRALADVKSSYKRMNALPKVKKIKELTEDELNLEPLCKDRHYGEIMSCKEDMKNRLLLHLLIEEKKELVSCKYRYISKKFWQESDTEKILYGLDDIEGASDIIIVEGEMDKLAMEEAGFRNCVSVPDGAPPKVN